MSRAGQAWGIPMPDDPSSVIYVWVDALINYLTRRRVRHRRGAGREVVAGGSARDRQGHHAISRRHLAGDADERRAAGAAPDFRPRLGPLPRRENEQVARDDGRSARRGRKIRRRAPAAVPRERNCVRQRRRLHLGAVRGPLQRRSGEQPRQPRQPRGRDGREVSRAAGCCRRAARDGSPASRGQSVDDYRREMDAFALEGGAAAAFRIVDAANEYIAETEPWALARDDANADRLSQVLFDVAEAVRIAAVLLLPIMPRSSAEILRRVGAGAGAPRLDDADWRNEGERLVVKGEALWPRSDATSKAGLKTGGMPRPARSAAMTRPVEGRQFDRSRNVDETKNPGAAPAPPPAQHAAALRQPPRPGRQQDHDRRFHEGRAADREGADRRESAELAQAGQAEHRRRHASSGRSSPASPKRTSPRRSSGARL